MLFSLCVPVVASAEEGVIDKILSAGQAPYIPLAPIPGTVKDGCDFTSVTARCETNFLFYLNGAYKAAIGVAGMLAVVMIIWWGFQYVLTSKEGGKTDSREGITNAIIGLLLTLGSWLIVYTINPKLVELDFKTEKATDYEAPDLEKAFLKQMEDYQKENQAIEKERAALKADIAAKEAQIKNIETEADNQAKEAANKELQTLRAGMAKVILKDAINTSLESVTFHTSMQAKNSASVAERLQMANSALESLDKAYYAQTQILEANGAADAIPAQRAVYETKRKEMEEAIAHRERCPNGDFIITNANTFSPTIVPCK
jgi:hypothetical protein